MGTESAMINRVHSTRKKEMYGIIFCILVYLLGILTNFNRNHFLKGGECYVTAPMLSLHPTGIYLFNH